MSLKLTLKWTMKFEIVRHKFTLFWNTTNYVQKFWGGTPCTTGNSRFGIWFFTWPLLCRRCLFIRSLCNSRPNWFCSPAGHTCFLFLSFAQWQLFRQKVLILGTRQIVFSFVFGLSLTNISKQKVITYLTFKRNLAYRIQQPILKIWI